MRELNYPIVGLIASLNPVFSLEATVRSLFAGGATRVIVVDDGSYAPGSRAVFNRIQAIGAEVIHLERNIGKSRALMLGFKVIPEKSLIVQTDDDCLAGDLCGPARMLRERTADIVDIRAEAPRTHSLLGASQELSYWMVNAVIKRLQSLFRARLWMSGASVMYTHEAGKELLLEPSFTMTEDTEGLFRARSKGFRVRYYAKRDARFTTMVPEDFRGLRKQWQRWATGSGQVISMYGLGGGNARIATINVIAWVDLVALPVPLAIHYGLASTVLWALGYGQVIGILGALSLKRARVALVGVLFPVISVLWAYHAVEGLFLANQLAKSGETVLTWVPPKRTAI